MFRTRDEAKNNKTKWLPLKKMSIQHEFDYYGCQVALEQMEFKKKDLDRLGISPEDVSGTISDTMDKVYSYLMCGEKVRDEKSLKGGIWALVFRMQEVFQKNFGVKLWIDKDVMNEAIRTSK